MRSVVAGSPARTRVVRAGLVALVPALMLGGGLMTLTAGTTTTAAPAPLPSATIDTTLAPQAAGPTSLPVATGTATGTVVITPDTMAVSSILIPSAGIYTSYAPEALQPGTDGSSATAVIPELTAGIWSGGATPSDTTGTVLLWGHVDSAFHGLAATVPHGAVYLRDAKGRLTEWQVTRLYIEPRSSLHPNLYTKLGPHRLAVVTCGGPVRDGHYEDNVILIAEETPR